MQTDENDAPNKAKESTEKFLNRMKGVLNKKSSGITIPKTEIDK